MAAGGVLKTYSAVQAAAILGVHRNTLVGWCDKGCPFVSRGDRDRGVEWEIAIPEVVDWRIKTAVENALASYQDESGKITREEADRRRAIAIAITAEVAADESLHSVVHRHEAEADIAAFCQVLKAGLSNAGSKIASRSAQVTDAAQIQELCKAEINRAFRMAQAELDQRWAGKRKDDDDDGGGDN